MSMIWRSRRVRLMCAAFAMCELYSRSVSLITRRGEHVNPGRIDEPVQAQSAAGGHEVGAVVHVQALGRRTLRGGDARLEERTLRFAAAELIREHLRVECRERCGEGAAKPLVVERVRVAGQ